MTRALLDAAMLVPLILGAGGAGWWLHELSEIRRFRRIAESERAERMEP